MSIRVPGAPRRRPVRKGRFSSASLVGCAIALLGLHGAACDDTGGTGGQQDAAADAPDAFVPDDSALPTDAAADVVADVVEDTALDSSDTGTDTGTDTGPSTGTFVAGTYLPVTSPCGLGSFAVTLTSGIVLNPFGSNGAVTFTLDLISSSTARTATGSQTIDAFQAGPTAGWTCVVEQSSTTMETVTCSPPAGGGNPCVQTLSLAN